MSFFLQAFLILLSPQCCLITFLSSVQVITEDLWSLRNKPTERQLSCVHRSMYVLMYSNLFYHLWAEIPKSVVIMKIKWKDFSCAKENTAYIKYMRIDPLNCHIFHCISGKIMISWNWVRYTFRRDSNLITGVWMVLFEPIYHSHYNHCNENEALYYL